MSSRQRLVNLAIAAVIAVVAVVVIVVSGGGSDDTSKSNAEATVTATGTPAQQQASPGETSTPTPAPTPEVTAIEIKDGKVLGGVAKLRVTEGERVRFTVTSDVADEVHVHAYDFMKDVEPGKPVTFNFPATITGITEVELEDAGLQIASLRVDQ